MAASWGVMSRCAGRGRAMVRPVASVILTGYLGKTQIPTQGYGLVFICGNLRYLWLRNSEAGHAAAETAEAAAAHSAGAATAFALHFLHLAHHLF